jgi:hypothetical protein
MDVKAFVLEDQWGDKRGWMEATKFSTCEHMTFEPKVEPRTPLGTRSSRLEFRANQCSLTEQKSVKNQRNKRKEVRASMST